MPDSAVDINWFIDRRLVHEIHTSERKAFRTCRRRWEWFAQDRYYPKLTAKPLAFGIAYHAGLEVFYDPNNLIIPPELRVEAAIAAFVKVTEDDRKMFHQSSEIPDDEVDKDFDARLELGIGMLRYLASSIAPQEAKQWTPVQVEVEFMVPIPHPETGVHMRCKCQKCWEKWSRFQEVLATAKSMELSKAGQMSMISLGSFFRENAKWDGLPVVLAGRIDALMMDEYGDLHVVDWKTAARVSERHDFLDLDDQAVSYPWALWSIGMKVRGFIYAEQRKGFPKPPKQNKNRRLGRLFSVAADQDTDYNTYLNTIQEHDAEAYKSGLYDVYLEYLQNAGAQFFSRIPVTKTEEEYLHIQKNLGYEVLDMLREDLYVYPNPSKMNCSWCAFQVPCVEKTRGGDFQYALSTLFEKKTPYYLRERPSTDGWSA